MECVVVMVNMGNWKGGWGYVFVGYVFGVKIVRMSIVLLDVEDVRFYDGGFGDVGNDFFVFGIVFGFN